MIFAASLRVTQVSRSWSGTLGLRIYVPSPRPISSARTGKLTFSIFNLQLGPGWRGRTGRGVQGRPVYVRRPDFPESELEADFLHDGDAEIGFIARRIFDLAVGLVDAHELRPLLQFLFSGGEFGGVQDFFVACCCCH